MNGQVPSPDAGTTATAGDVAGGQAQLQPFPEPGRLPIWARLRLPLVLQGVLARYRDCGFRYRLYSAIRLRTCPFEVFEPYVPAAGTIVDLGCGHGLFSNLLSLTSPARRIIGIDVSPKKIDMAKRSAAGDPRIEFRLDDVRSFEIPGDAACVCLLDVLTYLNDQEKTQLLARIHRSLPPGGRLLIKSMHNAPQWKNVLVDLHMGIFDRFVMHAQLDAERRDWPIPRLFAALTGLGFQTVGTDIGAGYPYPRCLVSCVKTSG